MRVTSLGSGSSGNALLVEAGPLSRTKILIDAGFNGRILVERLLKAGISPASLSAILITHEHSDHILGLPTLLKRYAIPVFADPGTIAAIKRFIAEGVLRSESGALVTLEAEVNTESGSVAFSAVSTIEEIIEPPLAGNNGKHQLFTPFPAGSRCVIGDIEVASFPVSHDAAAPCGFLLSAGGCRVCVAIDSGEVTATMLKAMQQADLLVLESNHDRERLLRGPYPYYLKQRILSPTGHLSNDQAADAVLRTWRGDSIRWLWLSHLSKTNNTPKLALSSMRARLMAAGASLAQVHISVLSPGMGGTWDSTQLWHAPSLWEMEG